MLSTEIALKDAIPEFMKHLEKIGKKPRTLSTYGKDCEQIVAFFGSEKKLKNILPVHVAGFYKSDALLLISKSGKERQAVTVRKTKRVLKAFLIWAVEEGYITALPLPKQEIVRPSCVS